MVVVSVNLVQQPEFSGALARRMSLRLPRAWHGLSLRAKLILVFVLIDLIAALLLGAVAIVKARTSTRVEIAASMALAETLVDESIRLSQQQSPMASLAEHIPTRQRLMRHVRLSVRDAAGLPMELSPEPAGAPRVSDREPAPAWFSALIAPPIERRELPVVVGGIRLGSVLITGEAGDEIAEAWDNIVAVTAAGAALNVAVIALLYVLFGRVLRPLTGLAHGMRDLEVRNYDVRLARPDARELGAIADRFNSLAQALDALRAENAALHRRLITAQDDERRHTALELHDEVGPCLFGLKANASSIATLAGERADAAAGIAERAREMLDVIDHLQAINRSLLGRLRPMALGNVPLGDLLSEVVRERARQNPDIRMTFAPGAVRASYGEPIDLTIYRCVQESLTNAIRHAQATRVDIALGEAKGTPTLRLLVEDDGRGIDLLAPRGHGLRGMQERVQALGGRCAIEAPPRGGARICIDIPLAQPAIPSDRREHTVP